MSTPNTPSTPPVAPAIPLVPTVEVINNVQQPVVFAPVHRPRFMGITFVEDISKAHTWAENRIAAGIAFLFAVAPHLLDYWTNAPQDLKDALPHGLARYVSLALIILVPLSRVIIFKPSTEPDNYRPVPQHGGQPLLGDDSGNQPAN
jgi:hypothetical protein